MPLEQLMKRLYCMAMAEISRLPRPVADEWEWQYQGACRDLPTEMFFHPDGERGPRRRNRENTAKAICASCPVIAACRKHALSVQEPYDGSLLSLAASATRSLDGALPVGRADRAA